MEKKVNADFLEKLAAIVGSGNVLTTAEEIEAYAHDELPGLFFPPEAVVRPSCTEEVAAIMRLANAARVPVTPRGLGTGLSGGALAVEGGIVLSLEKFNRILEIDEENLMVTVEPGVVTGQLQKEVEARGLFYPVDPASLDSCSIGGNVAENAGGPRAAKYGITRDYVKGLEVVLPTGEIINYGGKVVKNVTGYDLPHLFIGSEGTLGIITKIILKLLPLPQCQVDLLVPFASFAEATAVVTKIICERKIVPVVLEFMDQEGVRACSQFLGKDLPFMDAEAQLIIGLDGHDEEQVMAQCEAIGELCLESGAADVLVADTPFTKEQLWEARRILLETLKAISPVVEVEDIVVPRSRIPEMIAAVVEISRRTGFPMVNWGHAGDGNIHVGILKKDMDDAKWEAELPQVMDAVFTKALELGGMISGEHGIGYLKRQFLPKAVGGEELALMRRLKDFLDPNHILNPGKLFF